MSKIMDLTGQRFGRLIAVNIYCKNKWGRNDWLCKCDCGNEKIVDISHLKAGDTKSCGCLQKEIASKINTIHGQTHKTPEYRAWSGMKARCYCSSLKRFKDYGGRGIKVCDRWKNSFENFFKDMGKRPSDKHSLDRYPNINGDYEPTNCRWATNKEQGRGQRTNRWIEYNGERKVLQDWANELKVSSDILSYHLKTKSISEAILFFNKKRHKRYIY